MKTAIFTTLLMLGCAGLRAADEAPVRDLLTPTEAAKYDVATNSGDALLREVATRANDAEKLAGDAAALKAENAQLKAQAAALQTQVAALQATVAKLQADLAAANKRLADIKVAGGF